ncbi:hypothetical protein [Gracilibacillus sp. JCM 18860]
MIRTKNVSYQTKAGTRILDHTNWEWKYGQKIGLMGGKAVQEKQPLQKF